MASQTTVFSITTPGDETGLRIGFPVPEGHTLDLAITVFSMPTGLTVANKAVNDVVMTIGEGLDKKTYPVGSVLVFDVHAASGIRITRPETILTMTITARTTQGWRRVYAKDFIVKLKDIVP